MTRPPSPGGDPPCPSCGSSAEKLPVNQRRDLHLLRCPDCELIYQSRPLSPGELQNRFYAEDYYNLSPSDRNQGDIWTMKVKTCLAYLDIIGRYLPGHFSAPRLLDVGCSYGWMLESSRQRGFAADGIEISPAAADAARERNMTVYDRPIAELRLPAESFEVVTAIDLIEHVPDINAFVGEIHRIVKPEGVFLIVTPDAGSWAARIMDSGWPHYKLEHLFYFNKRSLAALLTRMGFEPLRIATGFKYLTFEYVVTNLERYVPGPLTRLLAFLDSTLPSRLSNTSVYLPTGLLAIARRPPSFVPHQPPSTERTP